MKYNKIKGTNDILPEESIIWQNVREDIEHICKIYGFQFEISPILEPAELFTRGIGEDTDIVNKEMYIFKSKSGKNIALKPEETVVLFRNIIENNYLHDNTVKKLYYFTPIFRYEKPQKGRYREFYQYGVEIINSDSYFRDAEVIEIGVKIIEHFELKNIELEINSIGCKTCRPNYKRVLTQYLNEHKDVLCDDCKRRINTNPLRVLDCKNEICMKTVANAPSTIDYLCDECRDHFEGVKNTLDEKSIKYVVNSKIVRGLDYYSKTVFEFIEKGNKLGAQSTIIGGGRYDYLGDELGKPNIKSIGFAGGFERLLMSIDKEYKNNYINKNKLNIVLYMENTLDYAEKVLTLLRENEIYSEIDYEHKKFQKQIKFADKKKAAFVFICGEDEKNENMITIKNMKTGKQNKTEMNIEKIKEVINGK